MKMAKHTKYMSKGGAVTDQQQMAMGNGSKKSKNKSKKGSVPGHNNLFA